MKKPNVILEEVSYKGKLINKTEVENKINSLLDLYEKFLSERKKTKNLEKFMANRTKDFIFDNYEKQCKKPLYDEFFKTDFHITEEIYEGINFDRENFIDILTELDTIVSNSEEFNLVEETEIYDFLESEIKIKEAETLNLLPKYIYSEIKWTEIAESLLSEYDMVSYLGKNYYVINN